MCVKGGRGYHVLVEVKMILIPHLWFDTLVRIIKRQLQVCPNLVITLKANAKIELCIYMFSLFHGIQRKFVLLLLMVHPNICIWYMGQVMYVRSKTWSNGPLNDNQICHIYFSFFWGMISHMCWILLHCIYVVWFI